MLTLKVVTLDNKDDEQTSLFFGDSISHAEGIMKGVDLKNYPNSRHIGYINEASDQPFMASNVMIVNSDNVVKHELLILPKSTCFITESGKTVDTFHSYFKEV